MRAIDVEADGLILHQGAAFVMAGAAGLISALGRIVVSSALMRERKCRMQSFIDAWKIKSRAVNRSSWHLMDSLSLGKWRISW
ncbi:hypothetical protein [Herminiimonas sp.]|uniref:hypothetical protein n=1 Tax=Herminiimonas sp. TaxID=1926289 RepID=UPI00271BEFD3|nr:hypothetical protein [Herminiimonas sp.]MDO8305674.1 hypothetical protein [Herminiimonas sp.]